MFAQKRTAFLTFLVLFAFMEETKLAMAFEESLMSVSVCEGGKAIIRCLVGGDIKVVEASYGRHDGSTCPHPSIRTTNCHAGNSLSVVQSRCDNQASCELDASNSVFGDPCWGTYKYLEVKFMCVVLPPNTPRSVTVCEGKKATISCQGGKKVNVLEASYGRHDRSTCPHPSIHTTNCHAGNSLLIVKAKCDNKPSCELDSNNSVFGDPCGGTYKYLSVKYQCIQ
ncbi:L-rhamnose-binding lectin CSL3-like [Oculina patagonica]